MELITNPSNIDYKKMFDRENFYYLDQYGEVCQYTEMAAFDITEEKYIELTKHKANCGRCFICFYDEDKGLTVDFESLIGYVVDITTKVFPDSEDYEHYCVEFALMPEKIVEAGEKDDFLEGSQIALFYFKDDDAYSDKVLVSSTEFRY